MESILSPMNQHLAEGRPFATATILTSNGSTPRGIGSKMLVDAEKTVFGTIGGGLLEAKVIDQCMRLMSTSMSKIAGFTLDKEAKQGMDMICGGNVTVYLQSFVPPFPETLLSHFCTLEKLENEGKKTVAISRLNKLSLPETWLEFGGSSMDEPELVPLLDKIEEYSQFSGGQIFHESIDGNEYVIEVLRASDTLYIFGAGHVGLQLARIADITEFPYVVIDDRIDFANSNRFPNARSVRVTEDFSDVFADLAIDENSHLVILTRGHLHDQTVLERALKTQAKYIGMIGSRRKRETIYKNLKEKGVTAARLQDVHSPIGLDIQAETPAEIAVSIMAELLQKRAIKVI